MNVLPPLSLPHGEYITEITVRHPGYGLSDKAKKLKISPENCCILALNKG
jgi:hypothetical protein